MRARPVAALGLLLAFCAFCACQLVWSYDDFKDRPGTGGSMAHDAGRDADGDAEPDAGSDAAANGLACEAGTDCQSGNCELGDDGGTVCCASTCGVCESCDGDGGACASIPKGAPSPDCNGALACDGFGNCKTLNGGPCAADAICLSGVCFTGVCCVEVCPPCQVCSGDGEGCTPRWLGDHDARCGTLFNVCDGLGHCFL